MYIPAKKLNDASMTVGDLKRLLSEIPDDVIIYSEGCDCTEEAYGIDYEKNICEIARKRRV